MPIVDAKCTNCGATLQVDDTKEAMVCQYCGSAFVVEKAINNYTTTIINNNNFAGANITVAGGDVENYRTLARRAVSSSNGDDAIRYYKKIVEINPNDWEAAFYVEVFTAYTNDIGNINENAVKEYATNWSESAKDSSVDTQICNMLTVYADTLYRNGIQSLFVNASVFYNAMIKAVSLYDINYNLTKRENKEKSLQYLQKILDKLKDGKNMLKCNNHPQIGQLMSAVENLEQKYMNEMMSKNPNYVSPKSISNSSSGNTKSGGCYIATCVYGSYDCPQVWTLRRFRDYTLAETWYGRAFINTYYAISPTIVKVFGDQKWFKSLWKHRLDKMISKLHNNGIEDTPYNDKEW